MHTDTHIHTLFKLLFSLLGFPDSSVGKESTCIQICWHMSAALSQHHLLGFEIAQLEFHHLH